MFIRVYFDAIFTDQTGCEVIVLLTGQTNPILLHTTKEHGVILVKLVNQWRWTEYGISKEREFKFE